MNQEDGELNTGKPACVDGTVQAGELDMIRDWCGRITGSLVGTGGSAADRLAAGVPFSFCCGERTSRDWLRTPDTVHRSASWTAGRRTHVLSWREALTGLVCELELSEFADFPALEWRVCLRNEGLRDTPPIHDFNVLDSAWMAAGEKVMPELERALGGDAREDDFQLLHDELRQSMWQAARTIRMDSAVSAAFRKVRNGSLFPADGRPSATWLPFANLRTGEDGLMLGLGWAGEWFAEFAHDGKGTTRIRAGMEHLNLCLQPGESIRSPLMLTLYWRGTPRHAHNLLRQFILAWHTPQDRAGAPLETPICCGSWGGMVTAGHLELIGKIAEQRVPYDYYWVDAGWYGTATEPCPDVFKGKWWIVGDWRVNRHYHPHGLKPISDAAHRAGMKFLVWFEPERAKYGTPVTLEHPEWFLRRESGPFKENEDLLLDLGKPPAWNYIVNTISTLIAENGIDGYREDFNFDPSPYWRQADAEGRAGITQIRFVEGLYAFWDELRRRHPGLLIDNCASGGRRLELETLSRSLALWRTDYNCFPHMNPDASQLHTAGLVQWIPANSTSPCATPGDSYQARSAFSAGLVFSLGEFNLRADHKSPDYPWDWHRAILAEARRLRPFFYGDAYPLTPCCIAPDTWSVLQLHRRDLDAGAVLAFRRRESPMTSGTFQLQGVDPAHTYLLTDTESGRSCRCAGRKLLSQGLPLSIAARRGSCLVVYERVRKRAKLAG